MEKYKSDLDQVKQQVNSVFLQLELAGKELIGEIIALESILKSSYEQNKVANDIAMGLTVNNGEPILNVISLQETIAEKRSTLDNLYSLDDKLKLLDKEVSKAEEILHLLKVENPKLEDKEKIMKYASRIDIQLERVNHMSLDIENQFVKGRIINEQNHATPDSRFGNSTKEILLASAQAFDKAVGTFYPIVDSLKAAIQAQSMPKIKMGVDESAVKNKMELDEPVVTPTFRIK